MSQRMIYQTEPTRQKILTEAERCFGELGFFDTQMKDIAAAVGMSRNTLYRYYRDKFDLGFAILEKALAERFSSVSEQLDRLLEQPDLSYRDAIGELLESLHLDSAGELDDRFIAEFDAYFAGNRIPDDFRERLSRSTDDGFFDRLTVLIQRGQKVGQIRSDLDARQLGTTLSNAIQAFHHRMLLRSSALIELQPDEAASLNPILLKLLIDGLAPQSPSLNTESET
ncbi:TetR/AcrR family transcriptional regulator [Reinekea blandensis]|nr:TetR/AcrR family transcriptional regulator [Reinekea blandensis]